MKNLYVGNLPHSITEGELRSAFEAHGAVEKVSIVTDRDTGRSRGFRISEMTNAGEAEKATAALNGSDMGGRTLTMDEAERSRRAAQWWRRWWWWSGKSLAVEAGADATTIAARPAGHESRAGSFRCSRGSGTQHPRAMIMK